MAATLLQLRVGVLDNLNDLQNEPAGTGDRYKLSALNRAINRSIRHYANKLNAFFQGYLTGTITLDILSGVNSYALGTSFRSPIYQVRRTVNNVDYYLNPIYPYNQIIATDLIPNTEWLPSHWLEGNTIFFNMYPASNETGAVVIKHQYKLVDLSLDTSALDDQLYDAEDCIMLRATIAMLKAKDVSGAFKNISGWEGQLKDAEAVFFSQVGNRYVKPDKPLPVDTIQDYY